MTQLNGSMSLFWQTTYAAARRVVVGVIGGTVVLFGVILIVTPGPAVVVIPLGLAILATEFVWAKRLLRRVRDDARGVFASIRNKRGKPESQVAKQGESSTTASVEDNPASLAR